MATKPYASFKGDFFIRKRGSILPWSPLGNSQEASLGLASEYITLTSSGNEKGTLAKEETSRTMMLNISLNSLGVRQCTMYLYSSGAVAQAAVTAVAFTLPAMAAGEAFNLAHGNVSNVEIADLVEGGDYRVHQTGVIVAIKTIVAGKSGTYDAAIANDIGAFTAEGEEYEVLYVSENTGKKLVFARWKPDPAATVALVSSEFAKFDLAGECLVDENLPIGPLGRIAKMTDIGLSG